MADTIKFWGGGTPRTLRPIWVAEELGLVYEHELFGPRTGHNQTPEYTRLNPAQKIPLLTIGDFRLTESLAISRYLIEKFDISGIFLNPEDPEGSAAVDEMCLYIFGEIDETGLYVIRRHAGLPAIYGEAPAAVTAAVEYITKHLLVISGKLGDNSYLVGNRFSLADVMLTSVLGWAASTGVELTQNLAAYNLTMRARPAFIKANKQNAKVEI